MKRRVMIVERGQQQITPKCDDEVHQRHRTRGSGAQNSDVTTAGAQGPMDLGVDGSTADSSTRKIAAVDDVPDRERSPRSRRAVGITCFGREAAPSARYCMGDVGGERRGRSRLLRGGQRLARNLSGRSSARSRIRRESTRCSNGWIPRPNGTGCSVPTSTKVATSCCRRPRTLSGPSEIGGSRWGS